MRKSLILSFGAVCIFGGAQAVAVKTKTKAEAKDWWNQTDNSFSVPASDSSSSFAAPAADTSTDDWWAVDSGDASDN